MSRLLAAVLLLLITCHARATVFTLEDIVLATPRESRIAEGAWFRTATGKTLGQSTPLAWDLKISGIAAEQDSAANDRLGFKLFTAGVALSGMDEGIGGFAGKFAPSHEPVFWFHNGLGHTTVFTLAIDADAILRDAVIPLDVHRSLRVLDNGEISCASEGASFLGSDMCNNVVLSGKVRVESDQAWYERTHGQPIPEPTSVAFALAGVIALLGYRRSRTGREGMASVQPHRPAQAIVRRRGR